MSLNFPLKKHHSFLDSRDLSHHMGDYKVHIEGSHFFLALSDFLCHYNSWATKTTGQTYPSKLVHIPQNVCWHFEEGFSTKPPSLICMHQPQHSIWPWCRCVRYYLHHQCGLRYKWLQQNQWIAWCDYPCRCLYQSGQISRVEHVGTNTHHHLSTWPLLHQNISLHDIFLKLSYPALWKS